MEYLKVKKWNEFQHYKDRSPPWIKLQTDTFQNYEFSRLQDASKLLAVCIWTLASRTKDGTFPNDFEWIKRQCNLSIVKIEHFKDLINHGFILNAQDASVPIAECLQDAIPETYREETEAYNEERETESIFFERFWEAFPRQRRGSKPKAEKSYLKAIKKTTEEKIYEAVVRYAGSDTVRNGYAKGAESWLNDERWTDQPVASSSPKPANGSAAYGDSILRVAATLNDSYRREEDLWTQEDQR